MLAMQYQLARSQWWPREEIERQQLRQLDAVLRHAVETAPFYARRLIEAGYSDRSPIDRDRYTRLPITHRADVQTSLDLMQSSRPPADHGRRLEGYTSGSIGTPLRFFGTEITHFFWGALNLRDHRWHGRDLTRKHAVIRAGIDDGPVSGWGASSEVAYPTGPGAGLNIRADIDAQLHWLQREAPGYLLTHPSNLRALALRSIDGGLALPGLLEARTFGELVEPELRDLCRRAWNVPLIDMYSAEEVGYIALQCPEHEHYHVQSENLIVEVLDDADRPCAPGEIGRVVVTTLHNFMMPLRHRRLRRSRHALSLRPRAAGARTHSGPSTQHGEAARRHAPLAVLLAIEMGFCAAGASVADGAARTRSHRSTARLHAPPAAAGDRPPDRRHS
jgi:phenylacetate-CoA ligase